MFLDFLIHNAVAELVLDDLTRVADVGRRITFALNDELTYRRLAQETCVVCVCSFAPVLHHALQDNTAYQCVFFTDCEASNCSKYVHFRLAAEGVSLFSVEVTSQILLAALEKLYFDVITGDFCGGFEPCPSRFKVRPLFVCAPTVDAGSFDGYLRCGGLCRCSTSVLPCGDCILLVFIKVALQLYEGRCLGAFRCLPGAVGPRTGQAYCSHLILRSHKQVWIDRGHLIEYQCYLKHDKFT